MVIREILDELIILEKSFTASLKLAMVHPTDIEQICRKLENGRRRVQATRARIRACLVETVEPVILKPNFGRAA